MTDDEQDEQDEQEFARMRRDDLLEEFLTRIADWSASHPGEVVSSHRVRAGWEFPWGICVVVTRGVDAPAVRVNLARLVDDSVTLDLVEGGPCSCTPPELPSPLRARLM